MVDEDEFLPSDQNSSNIRHSMLLYEDNPMTPSNNMRLSQRPTIASNSLTGSGPMSGSGHQYLTTSSSSLGGALKRSSGTNAANVGKSRSSLAMIPGHKGNDDDDASSRVESVEGWSSPLAPAPNAAGLGPVPIDGVRQSQAKRGSDGMKMKSSIAFSDTGYHARKSTCKPHIPAFYIFL